LTLVLELDIRGLARFLSHADLQRALVRACVRARLDLRYTQGFNPHPKMSLPLPKPVGLASCGDVLTVRLQTQEGTVPDEAARSRMQQALDAQWPQGIAMRALHVVPGKITLYACGYTCSCSLRSVALGRRVRTRMSELMAQERFVLERTNPQKPHKTKKVDVRPFIASIEMTDQTLKVNCLVQPSGSIRVEEILMSLGLDPVDLNGPVQRSDMTWQLQ
jgi:radical SAM-linked protein